MGRSNNENLVHWDSRSLHGAITDESGRYEIDQLPAGPVVVQTDQTAVRRSAAGAATAATSEEIVYAPTTQGGAHGAPIVLGNGGRAILDLHLTRARGTDVTIVLHPDEHRVGPMLIPLRKPPVSLYDHGILFPTRRDGARATFSAVPPGRYLVYDVSPKIPNLTCDCGAATSLMYLPFPDQSTVWVSTPLVVGGTDLERTVEVHRALRVTGRIEVSGGAPPATIGRPWLSFSRADAEPTFVWQVLIHVEPSGAFVADGFTPGRWRLTAEDESDGEPWRLASVTLGGRSISAMAAGEAAVSGSFTIGTHDVSGIVLHVRRH